MHVISNSQIKMKKVSSRMIDGEYVVLFSKDVQEHAS